MAFVSYYVCAHQDDWQLFHGELAASDVARANTRVIFIYVTAGELDHSQMGVPQAIIWPAREHAAMACVEALTGQRSQPPKTIDVLGHSITRYACANTASYFLRIREGLPQLQHGYEATKTTVDDTSSYTWFDLVATLRELIARERGEGGETQCIHTHAADQRANGPQGHGDHWAVGAAVEAAVLDGSHQLVGWIDYAVAQLEPNLSTADAERKRRLMRDVYSRVYAREAGIDDWGLARSFYEAWIPRSYVAGPQGAVPSPTTCPAPVGSA